MKKDMTRNELFAYMNKIAPNQLAEKWDNVGMLIDMGATSYHHIMVSLDLSQQAVDQAIQQGIDLIITHHPIFFQAVQRLSKNDTEQRLVMECIRHNISIYSAHTNLDSSAQGVNVVLANQLQLQNHRSIEPVKEKLAKIVVYVPQTHVDAVRNAMCEVGAGDIGDYSHCTFAGEGVGTFFPKQGTTPFLGQVGKLKKVEEVRLESVVRAEEIDKVIQAILQAHPYEEVAYDVLTMEKSNDALGLIRMGELPKPMTGKELMQWVKTCLDIPFIRFSGNENTLIQCVAVSSGSGFSAYKEALQAGAQALVSGELKHNMAIYAKEDGLLLIDAGHYETERIVCLALLEGLQERFNKVEYKTTFCLHDSGSPIQVV